MRICHPFWTRTRLDRRLGLLYNRDKNGNLRVVGYASTFAVGTTLHCPLLSPLNAETDPLVDFGAGVEGLETCREELTRDESLSCGVKSALQVLEDTLAQSRIAIEAILKSATGKDERVNSLEAQYRIIRGCMETVLSGMSTSVYRTRLRRQCYKCLMSLQECLLPPFTIPEIATLANSLKSIAPSIRDPKSFDKLFDFIYTTLREADLRIVKPEVKKSIFTSWNEMMTQHEHNFTPLTLATLRAQGEAMLSCVTKAEGWLCNLISSVSNYVDKVRGAKRYETLDELVDDPQTRGHSSYSPSDIIASVNTTLAAIINSFLQSVESEVSDTPLTVKQRKALQYLSHVEMHIVNYLRRNCKGATKGKLERIIKEVFIDRVNLLWPSITDDLDPKISKVLNITRTHTLTVLNKTTILETLLRSVRKLTSDPEIVSLISLVLLGSFINAAEGAVAAHMTPYVLEKLTQPVWDKFVCPFLREGHNAFRLWTPYQPYKELREPLEPHVCVDGFSNGTKKAFQIWRDLRPQYDQAYAIGYKGEPSLCRSREYMQVTGNLHLYRKFWQSWGTRKLTESNLTLNCGESFRMKPRDFQDGIGNHYCQLGKEEGPREWNIQVSNFPPIDNQSKGLFTYCATPRMTMKDVVHQYHGNSDEAQLAQLQCLRDVDPVMNGREALPEPPFSILTKAAKMKYDNTSNTMKLTGEGIEDWQFDCQSLDQSPSDQFTPPSAPFNSSATNSSATDQLSPGEVPWISKLSTVIWGDNVLPSTNTFMSCFAGASVLTLIAGGIYYYCKTSPHRAPTYFRALLDDPGLISECLPLTRQENLRVPKTVEPGLEEGIPLVEVNKRFSLSNSLMEGLSTPMEENLTTKTPLTTRSLVAESFSTEASPATSQLGISDNGNVAPGKDLHDEDITDITSTSSYRGILDHEDVLGRNVSSTPRGIKYRRETYV
eukprot:Blabericola_migrator_1__7660@NODE_390_length_9055_cov_50_200267_g279_i1_p2_GENE_NODE_390_length_9055_cov_50_200267_g279_i1NODE_390_length_9055_cov_50_200267_g279_i1_p2_ORF_typecomplete_len944_score145_60_NODE_390_length_9055_cov_50_200267_g279_i160438874